MSGRIRAFLTPQAKQALIAYIALNGENYEKYSAYATALGWKLFSRRYLHNWVGRHRPAIQEERAQCVQKLRAVSTMDKQRRLNEMEVNSQQLQHRIQMDGRNLGADELIKLMDMHRKLCQAIAVERGEWGNKEDASTELADIAAQLTQRMQKALKEPAVDGSFKELPSG